jgi:hypothetical protein
MTQSVWHRGTIGGALALALLLGGCGGSAEVATDEFSTYTAIDGPSDFTNPLIGPKVEWQMQSFVGKAPPHAVVQRLLVRVYTKPFFAGKEEQVTSHYESAADDNAQPLKLVRIAAGSCGTFNAGCLKHESFGVLLADETLRRHVLTGYRIKVAPKEGEAEILALSPAMIQQQLSKVDAMVQGEAAVLAPDAPRLGIGVVAATSAPYEGAPRGVIVVVATPRSPAAAAGIAPGDVLLAIDAQPIRVTGDIARILSGLAARRALTLELERDGKPFSATLQL